MIQINDFDSPMRVAEKIINGTRKVPASALDKAAYRTFVGEELEEMVCNMFKLKEIKEIADYLMVYCQAHNNKNKEKL